MRYNLIVGTELDRDNHQIQGVQEKTHELLVRACQMFGGVSVYEGQGAWIAPSGNLVRERHLSVVIDCGESAGQPEKAKALADIARELFNQQCVLLTCVSSEAPQFV